ncbi:MAG TPA: hypothetical protein VFS11_10315, partial [Gemmatimonadales bacterium]|nr:hypothetical protein [Gemmatimonadales bacterium]
MGPETPRGFGLVPEHLHEGPARDGRQEHPERALHLAEPIGGVQCPEQRRGGLRLGQQGKMRHQEAPGRGRGPRGGR